MLFGLSRDILEGWARGCYVHVFLVNYWFIAEPTLQQSSSSFSISSSVAGLEPTLQQYLITTKTFLNKLQVNDNLLMVNMFRQGYTIFPTWNELTIWQRCLCAKLYANENNKLPSYPLAHRAKCGARVLISRCVESFYTRGELEKFLHCVSTFIYIYMHVSMDSTHSRMSYASSGIGMLSIKP